VRKKLAILLDGLYILGTVPMRELPVVAANKAMGRYGKARTHNWVGIALIAFGSLVFISDVWPLLVGAAFTSVEGVAGFFTGVVISSTILICGILAIRSPEKFNFQ
jgi:hypothetical protein